MAFSNEDRENYFLRQNLKGVARDKGQKEHVSEHTIIWIREGSASITIRVRSNILLQ
jgi:hypothetical protein